MTGPGSSPDLQLESKASYEGFRLLTLLTEVKSCQNRLSRLVLKKVARTLDTTEGFLDVRSDSLLNLRQRGCTAVSLNADLAMHGDPWVDV